MQDPDTGIVDLQSLVVLSSSPSYCALLQEIRKLCWVDLNELTSEDEKICFFTNILNVLLTHSAITEISRCSTRYNKPSGNMSDSGTEDHSSAINSWKCRLPRFDTAYCRTAYLKKYGYNIGQLGFIRSVQIPWYQCMYLFYVCSIYVNRL